MLMDEVVQRYNSQLSSAVSHLDWGSASDGTSGEHRIVLSPTITRRSANSAKLTAQKFKLTKIPEQWWGALQGFNHAETTI